MEKTIAFFAQILGIEKRVGKMKDSMSTAMLAGLFGTIVMDIVNLLLFTTKRSENVLAHMGASMLVSKQRTRQGKNILLGQIWHMITGIALALPMMSIFKRTGTDHHRVKGAFIGALSWGFIYNLGMRFRIYSFQPHLTKTHYSYLFTDIIYGVVTAEAIKTLADPKIFSDTNTSEQTQDVSDVYEILPAAK